MELYVMIACGLMTIATAILVIASRNTVHSALWMVTCFFFMAVLFLLLKNQFLAALQIIVYAGAIMMFIIYAIMMLNLRKAENWQLPRLGKIVGLFLLVILFAGLLMLLKNYIPLYHMGGNADFLIARYGEIAVLSHFLFSNYLLPFEVISILLTAGIVGAVALAKIKKEQD